MKRTAVGLAVVLAACETTETPEQRAARMRSESDSVRVAITEAYRGWTGHVAAGHADSLAQYYSATARNMSPNMATVHGRDSIVAGFGPMMQIGTWHFTFRPDSVWAFGDMAFETGTWSYHLVKNANTPPGMDTTEAGKYMTRWVRENGRWVMADDIYNTDKPLAPPPSPTRRRS